MNAWTAIAGVAIGTYLLRVSMFAVVGRWSLPRWTTTPMGFVGPAAVAALVASMLFTEDGRASLAPLPELAAVAAGFLAVRRTGNVMLAFAVGLPAFWLLAALTA